MHTKPETQTNQPKGYYDQAPDMNWDHAVSWGRGVWVSVRDIGRVGQPKLKHIRREKTTHIPNGVFLLYVRIQSVNQSIIHELGRNPASKHQIQPEDGDEQADARRDG